MKLITISENHGQFEILDNTFILQSILLLLAIYASHLHLFGSWRMPHQKVVSIFALIRPSTNLSYFWKKRNGSLKVRAPSMHLYGRQLEPGMLSKLLEQADSICKMQTIYDLLPFGVAGPRHQRKLFSVVIVEMLGDSDTNHGSIRPIVKMTRAINRFTGV